MLLFLKCALTFLMLAVLGCGSAGPETAEVAGIVRLDGEPLTTGIITFTPESGRSATGFIQSDGTFTLTTYDDGDGARPGVHQVTVTAGAGAAPTRPNFETDRPSMAAAASPIPPRYATPAGSGLTFEVKAGQLNHAEFDLESE